MMITVNSWGAAAAKTTLTAFTITVFTVPIVVKSLDADAKVANPNFALKFAQQGTSSSSGQISGIKAVYVGKPLIDVAKVKASAEADHAQRMQPGIRS